MINIFLHQYLHKQKKSSTFVAQIYKQLTTYTNMKKIFSIFAALIIAVTMSAQSAGNDIINVNATNAKTKYDDLNGMLLVTATWNDYAILLTIRDYVETDNKIFEGEEISVINFGEEDYAVTNSVKVEKKDNRTYFTGQYTSPESSKVYNVEISTEAQSVDDGVIYEPYELSNLVVNTLEDYNLLVASSPEIGLTVELAVDKEGAVIRANSIIKLNDQKLNILSGTVSQAYNDDLGAEVFVARIVVFTFTGKVGLELTMYNTASHLENMNALTGVNTKIIKNGQLIIIKNGIKYTVAGATL
jgi:hypothetical protein